MVPAYAMWGFVFFVFFLFVFLWDSAEKDTERFCVIRYRFFLPQWDKLADLGVEKSTAIWNPTSLSYVMHGLLKSPNI